MKVACIGTRELKSQSDKDLLYQIGRWLAQQGITVVSGNAVGSDQMYAKGANDIDPKLVELWLPWASYNVEAVRSGNNVHVLGLYKQEWEIMSSMHPMWSMINLAVKKLMMRNIRIVKGCAQVIGLPSIDKPWGGGTGMGMKLADYFKIPKINLLHPHDRARVYKKVYPVVPEDLRDKFPPIMCGYTGKDHVMYEGQCLVCEKHIK